MLKDNKLHVDLVNNKWAELSFLFERASLGKLPAIDGYFSVRLKSRQLVWKKQEIGYRIVLSVELLKTDWSERLLEAACFIFSDFHIKEASRSLLWYICYSVVEESKYLDRKEAAAAVIIANLLAKGCSLFEAKMEFIARFSMVPQAIMEPLFEYAILKLSLK